MLCKFYIAIPKSLKIGVIIKHHGLKSSIHVFCLRGCLKRFKSSHSEFSSESYCIDNQLFLDPDSPNGGQDDQNIAF